MLPKKMFRCLLLVLLLALPSWGEELVLPPIEELPAGETPPAAPVIPSLPAVPAVDAVPAFETSGSTGQPPAPPAGGDVLDETEFAKINWTGDYVEATGQAVPPPGMENSPQGKLLARRGAVVDLQRNLLEAVQGVKVDSKTIMTDFMASDLVRTEVQGLIKGVEVQEGSWDGAVYTVKGRVKLEKVRAAVLPALPKQPGKKAVPSLQPKTGGASGLLVDARHLPLIPALIFRIVDGNGKEVYGLDFVDQERFLASGLCDYHTNIDYARGAPRIASSPLVIKAVKTVSPGNADLVISNADAAKIRGNAFDFRIPCRVTVVKR